MKIRKKIKAQFAVEFVILLAFMFFLFLGILAIISAKIFEAKEDEIQLIAENIATLVTSEVDTAKPLSDGYTRTFSIPNKIKGNDYQIGIIDNRELIVNYLDKEYVYFLPEKVEGNVGRGINRIRKLNGI